VDIVPKELALLRVGVALSTLEALRTMQLPDTVVLKAPERVFRVVRLSGWPKLEEQALEIPINLRVRDKARLSTKTTAQGIKSKNRLMWGAPLTSLPNSEIREQATNFVFLHDLPSSPNG